MTMCINLIISFLCSIIMMELELEFDLYWLTSFNFWCNCSFDRYAYGLATLYIGESNEVFSFLGNAESWLILIPQPVLSVFMYYPKSPIWKCIPPISFDQNLYMIANASLNYGLYTIQKIQIQIPLHEMISPTIQLSIWPFIWI